MPRVVLLALLCALVLAVGFLMTWRTDGPTPPEEPIGELQRTAANQVLARALAEADSPAAVGAVIQAQPLRTAEDHWLVMERLEAFGSNGRSLLDAVAREYVAGPGHEDRRARQLLGHRLFEFDVPLGGFGEHRFLVHVELANRKRWFGPDEREAYDAAVAAAAEAMRHAVRLVTDREYRAADQFAGYIANHPRLAGLDVITHWAEPFLVCRPAVRPRSEVGAARTPIRAAGTARLERMQALWTASADRLAERGRLYQAVYQDLMADLGERFGWRRLMDPWGGRPELPVGRRTYRDGAPLAVLVTDAETCGDLGDYRGVPVSIGTITPEWGLRVDRDDPWRAGGFTVRDRWAEATTVARLALARHARQARSWREYTGREDVFTSGLARYYAARHTGVFVSGLPVEPTAEMQRLRAGLADRGHEYPTFPLARAIEFTSRSQVANWAAQTWKTDGWTAWTLFGHQAFVFTWTMLAGDADRRDRYLSFLDAYWWLGVGVGEPARAFRRSFDAEDDEDFDELQAAFEAELKRFLDAP